MVSLFDLCSRRFGVELEYNAYDGESRSKAENDLPAGIYDIGLALQKCVGNTVEVSKWQYTSNNNRWVLKPDSSCGIGVCTPPFRGKTGLKEFNRVISELVYHPELKSDSRCSFHVHVEIDDLSEFQILNLIEKWVNFELFFFLCTNNLRWINMYCVPLGFSKEFNTEESFTFNEILNKLSDSKYYSVNLFHYAKNRKKTIEFRCMGNEACLSPEDASNWCKLLLCFVDRCKNSEFKRDCRVEYKLFTDAVNFLNLKNYFGNDDEIYFWLIEKLSKNLDRKYFKNNISGLPYWPSVIKEFKKDLVTSIKEVESYLK